MTDNGMEQRLSRMEQKLDDLHKQIADISKPLIQIQERHNNLAADVEGVKKDLDDVMPVIQETADFVRVLKTTLKILTLPVGAGGLALADVIKIPLGG